MASINEGLSVMRKILASVALSFVIVAATAFPAQSHDIDPADIAALQERLEQESDTANDGSIENVDADGLEEARREAQLAAAAVAESTSPLEVDYQVRSDIEELSQYGYDIFRNVAPGNATETGRVPERYIIGIGDSLVLTLVGSTDRSITLRVDREGRIIIPDVGPIPVSGRSFGDVRRDIEDQVHAAMLGTEVYVSLGAGERALRIGHDVGVVRLSEPDAALHGSERIAQIDHDH